jgi:hypothetical protein
MNSRRFMDEHQVEDRSLAYLVGERAGSCITARWADNRPLWVKNRSYPLSSKALMVNVAEKSEGEMPRNVSQRNQIYVK